MSILHDIHVLLNLLNKLVKRDKCKAYQVFYHFDKFNITGAGMVDS